MRALLSLVSLALFTSSAIAQTQPPTIVFFDEAVMSETRALEVAEVTRQRFWGRVPGYDGRPIQPSSEEERQSIPLPAWDLLYIALKAGLAGDAARCKVNTADKELFQLQNSFRPKYQDEKRVQFAFAYSILVYQDVVTRLKDVDCPTARAEVLRKGIGLIAANSETRSEVERQASSDECAVTIVQDGKAVSSQVVGGVRRYALRGAPFRIEVPSALCDPSIGVFLKLEDFRFVAESPVIATISGFEMAGSDKENDRLFIRSEDPRLIPPFENMFDSVGPQYAASCSELGKCPLKMRAFRSYWAFASDGMGSRRNFAEFNRLTSDKPMLGTKGDVPVVVYTKVMPSMTASENQDSALKLLATHAFMLRFY